MPIFLNPEPSREIVWKLNLQSSLKQDGITSVNFPKMSLAAPQMNSFSFFSLLWLKNLSFSTLNDVPKRLERPLSTNKQEEKRICRELFHLNHCPCKPLEVHAIKASALGSTGKNTFPTDLYSFLAENFL